MELFSGTPLGGPVLESLERMSRSQRLALAPHWVAEDYIVFFDSFAKAMLLDSEAAKFFNSNDLGFLLRWLRKSNIQRLIDDCDRLVSGRRVLTAPAGTVVHWIAGNVPVLGMISLVNGLLAGNVNIVKASRSYASIFSRFIDYLCGFSTTVGGVARDGADLLKATFIVYVDKDDLDNQCRLSKLADVRVAWGGRDAIQAIRSLPAKINARDLVLGPKVSLIVAYQASLEESLRSERFCRLLASDILSFAQMGCNAPHNIFIVTEERSCLQQIAYSISEGLARHVSQYPRGIELAFSDSYGILERRFEYAGEKGKRFYGPSDLAFSVFVNSERLELCNPVFGCSIFISGAPSLEDVISLFPENVQTVGVVCDNASRDELARRLARGGALRVTDIGGMSAYSVPWDGVFPIHHLTNFVST